MHTFLFPIPATMQAFFPYFCVRISSIDFHLYTIVDTKSPVWQVCKNTSIYARNSIHVPVRESHPSNKEKKESPVLVYKLTARTEETILNPIIWNVFDELRMGTFVMDRNNLVFKQNLEIVFVPYMTRMKLFMEIDNF